MEILIRSLSLVVPIGMASIALKFSPPDLFIFANALIFFISYGLFLRSFIEINFDISSRRQRIPLFFSLIAFFSSVVWYFFREGQVAAPLAGLSLAVLTMMLLLADQSYTSKSS